MTLDTNVVDANLILKMEGQNAFSPIFSQKWTDSHKYIFFQRNESRLSVRRV